MSKETGGQAFPKTGAFHPEGNAVYDSADADGMTLRDYFAAKAMQSIIEIAVGNGLFAIGPSYKEDTAGLAGTSYLMADAMLAERSKP